MSDQPPEHVEAVYVAASEQWIHAEQMRWTILYNFLVGNTILLVAWSTLFAALTSNAQSVGLNIVLIGFCGVGVGDSIVWTFLEFRANRFSERYFHTGQELERLLLPKDGNLLGPFGVTAKHRSEGGLVKTHVVVVAVPIVFAAIYLALMIVSVYAAAGRL